MLDARRCNPRARRGRADSGTLRCSSDPQMLSTRSTASSSSIEKVSRTRSEKHTRKFSEMFTLTRCSRSVPGRSRAYERLIRRDVPREICSRLKLICQTRKLELTGRRLLSRAPIPGAVVAASSMRADSRRPRKRLTAITRAYNARAFAAAAAAVTRAKPASLSLRVASREPRRQGVTQFAQTSRELRGRELCAIACSWSRRRCFAGENRISSNFRRGSCA